MAKRFEYIASGGEDNFTSSLLIGKEILSVYKDGIGSAKLVTITPVNKEAMYVNSTGKLVFATPFQQGEAAIVLYQDGDPVNTCLFVAQQAGFVLNDAYAGFPYNASFFVTGSGPITLSSKVKPAGMDIDIVAGQVIFLWSPAIADAGTGITVSFTIENSCSTSPFSQTIDVVITPAGFGSTTFVSGDRLNDVEKANIEGTPGVTVTIELDEVINTNGGVIKVNGFDAFLGNTWDVVLDANGKGFLDVEINGIDSPYLGFIYGHFTVTAVDFGTIATNNTFRISKAF